MKMVATELLKIAKDLVATQIPYTDSDGRVAKVKFLAAKKALESAMAHLDNFSGIPPISGDYLTALNRIESIIGKL